MSALKDPRFLIASTIIGGFFVAYIFNPSDTMNGALIAAFAGAWGYYLGSSNSSSQVREQVGKALDVAAAATAATEKPQEVEVVNTSEKPAIVSEAAPVADDAGLPEYLR